MSRDSARSVAKSVLRRLGQASGVVLMLCLPAIWLAWEADIAQEQARLLAEVASDHAQAALRDVSARFERATAGLRAQDVQGDTTSLTARLLRAEPLVAPALGLLVVNARGVQVASTSPGNFATGSPEWWGGISSTLHTRNAVILGSWMTAPDTPSLMLVRRIEDIQGDAAGMVASVLPEEAVRSLVAPVGNAAGILDFQLRDANGHEILHGGAERSGSGITPPLSYLYDLLPPERWLLPQPVVASRVSGNLYWSATVAPRVALGLRVAEIERHGRMVLALVGGLLGLAVLLWFVRDRRHRPADGEVEHAEPPVAADPIAAGPVPIDREAEDLRRKIDEIAAERDRVLAAIGHDVRTPINSILGICALLIDGDLDDAQRKWLQRIRASCEALLAMLNGMLEIATAHVDGAEVNREPVDVANLVEEVGEVLRPQAQDKGLDLHITVDESALGLWNTDPTRLRQVLFNLVGNAIKYTVRGSVEMRALAGNGGAGRDMLRLCVSDTGPGIAEDERDLIFEQFRRGRDAVSRGQEGLGLGLALCREIATLLGGSLSLDRTRTVGSLFTFEMPAERVATTGAGGTPLTGRTALVVGLSEGVRRRVASHLESVGFDVETTSDGFLALGLAERAAHRHGTLDIIVIDAALAGLPADALLIRLRTNRPLERTRTVLVANGPVGALVEMQADAVVPHPVEARDLDRVLGDLFGTISPLAEIHPRAPSAPDARILVVEDNRINQALFVDVLSRAGFSAFAASSGEEAVQAVERGGFDGILMDVQMPGIDGVEATRRIRAGERHHRTPIVGLTAHTGATVRKRCLDAGMDLVLHKPVDLSRLPLRLREAIGSARLSTLAEDSRSAEQVMDEEPALDIADEYLEVLMAEIGTERARACITMFLTDTTAHVPAMQRMRSAAEWPALGGLAHSLAGAAATLGAVSFADALLMLEDATRIEEEVHVEAALREVQTTWDRARTMLLRRFDVIAAERRGAAAKKVV
jgi:signal transduction histidine kinase/CheY-like chemotaxis protein